MWRHPGGRQPARWRGRRAAKVACYVALSWLIVTPWSSLSSRRDASGPGPLLHVAAPKRLTVNSSNYTQRPRSRIREIKPEIPEVDYEQVDAEEAEHQWSAGLRALITYPRIFMAEVGLVVIISTLFESFEHFVRHRFIRKGQTTELKILDGFRKEITCLGFVGLLVYLGQSLSVADRLAVKLFPLEDLVHENPLFETFELVHMMIFLLVVVLLVQAAALLRISHSIMDCWQRYERARAWGTPSSSLESMLVRAGYLERASDPSNARGVELVYVRPFTYGANVLERMMLRQFEAHRVIMWRVVRQHFLSPVDQFEFSPKNKTRFRPTWNPATFSFESYLRGRLGENVLVLAELDFATWCLTALILLPVLYLCILMSWHLESVQCSAAWSLFAGASILVVCLEEDTCALTPAVPRDARHILKMFSCSESQMFQRRFTPTEDCLRTMGAPGLGDLKSPRKYGLVMPKGTLSSATYKRLFRTLAFWQAICVTSLFVSHLGDAHAESSGPAHFLRLLAWAEWPLMLFGAWPVLIRRLTMLDSLVEQDQALIRSVMRTKKKAFLRDRFRLVQLMGFYRRTASAQVPWTLPEPRDASQRTKWQSTVQQEAAVNLRRGLQRFKTLPRDQQLEIWEIFETLDAGNNECIYPVELQKQFNSMGFPDKDQNVADSLQRCVDNAQPHAFTWGKFRALLALATMGRPEVLEEDLGMLFDLIDEQSHGSVTVFQIAEWTRRIRNAITAGDVAGFLHQHFGEEKPRLSREEFMHWVRATLEHQSLHCEH